MRFFLHASRGPRPRDIELCATDAIQLFSALRDLNPEIFRWKEPAKWKSAALKKPFLDLADPAVIRELLLKGRNRTDVGRQVIEDLGFSIGLWNGNTNDSDSSRISLLNGCYCRPIPNNLYLDFPGFDDLERNDHLARRLIVAARNVLDADWVMLSRDIDDPRKRPYLDRAMFLSKEMPLHQRALHAIRERRARREPFDKGVIYILSAATD